MRIVAKKVLREFWEKYPDAEQPLKAWFKFVRAVSRATPAEIKAQFGHASLLRHSRVVFSRILACEGITGMVDWG